MDNGAGTNLKVGGTHPVRSAKKIFLPLYFFGSTSTSSRFGQYSLVSLLFAVLFTHGAPLVPYMESAPVLMNYSLNFKTVLTSATYMCRPIASICV